MDTAHDSNNGGRSHLGWISDQISAVLDPLAEGHRGWPAETIAPILARAWRREFHAELGKAALSDTAAAIRDGRPWSHALWTDGW
jgi:hypothetical protein